MVGRSGSLVSWFQTLIYPLAIILASRQQLEILQVSSFDYIIVVAASLALSIVSIVIVYNVLLTTNLCSSIMYR